MKPDQIQKILARFKGKTITQEILKEYCNLHHFDLITLNQYEDALFQQEHDDRIAMVLPLIFKELSNYQYPPTFITDQQRKAINEANEDIEWKISKALEDCGVVYREIDLLTKNLGSEFQAIMENAGKRASNMCIVVLTEIAKQKFGKNLEIKKLAEYYREAAKELGLALQKSNKVV